MIRCKSCLNEIQHLEDNKEYCTTCRTISHPRNPTYSVDARLDRIVKVLIEKFPELMK